MAQTTARSTQVADRISRLAGKVLDLAEEITMALAENSAYSVAWGATETPAAIAEDEFGNIQSRTFSRQQISNAIGTLAAIDAAAHRGNLALVADPNRR